MYVSGFQWHARQQLLVSLVVAEANALVKVTSSVLFKLHATGYTVRSKIFSNINIWKGLTSWYQVFIGTRDRSYFFSCGLSQRLYFEVSSLQKTLDASTQQIQTALTGTLGFTNLSSGLTTPLSMTKSLKPGPSPERKHHINNPRFNKVNMCEADNQLVTGILIHVAWSDNYKIYTWSTVKPKNNTRAITSFCVHKLGTSCGFL